MKNVRFAHTPSQQMICLVALIVSQVVAFAGCNLSPRLSRAQAQNEYRDSTQPTNARRSQEPSVQTLIQSLISSDEPTRTSAEQELLKRAEQSVEDRKQVIDQLLVSVQARHDLDGTHSVLDTRTYEYWRSVTTIFAELKATEAIDVMIACIQCSNGYSGNMGEPPASSALVRMNEAAIANLSRALLQEHDGYKRIRIVLCLSRIGGPKAKLGLREALASEKDPTVKEYIRHALSMP